MDPIVAEVLGQAMVFMGVMAIVGAAVFLKYKRVSRGTDAAIRSADAEILRRLDEVTARLARVEAGVDASAIEIERISEGQRFTTRLLADRTDIADSSRR